MSTSWNQLGFGGSHNRYEEFTRLLNDLASDLKPLIIQPEPGKPKLTGIKLYVYGFSRGAQRRAFVRWLSELLPPPAAEGEKPPQCLQTGGMQLPVSVEFLGLLDTVASRRVWRMWCRLPTGICPGQTARWSCRMMETYGGLIKKCVHLVSGHEQRLCFPLDSVRRANGKYPPCATGGGLPGDALGYWWRISTGDQGKANGENDSLLLSQVVLNDLYSASFQAGAPLKVPVDTLPVDLKKMHGVLCTLIS